MKLENIYRMKFMLFALFACAFSAFGMARASAQEAEAGDAVIVTWNGNAVKGWVDRCRVDGCYVHLDTESNGRFSEGTIFKHQEDIQVTAKGAYAKQATADSGAAQVARLKYKVGQEVECNADSGGGLARATIVAIRDDSEGPLDHKLNRPYQILEVGHSSPRWVREMDIRAVRN